MLQITIFKDTIKQETFVSRIVDLETTEELAAMDRETGLIDFSVLRNHVGTTISILVIDITNNTFRAQSREEKILLSVKRNSNGIMSIEY